MDLLAPFAPTTLVLLAARVGGLVMVAPLFSAKTIPMPVRTALVALFTWLLHPMALSWAKAPALTPAQFLTETLVGFAVGLGAALMVGAAEAMGDLVSINTGLSGAASLDPITNQSMPVFGKFASLFALTVLLSVNAHVEMLEALAGTLRLVPVGAPLDVRAGLFAMVSLAAELFSLGLRFAAPVVAMVLLGNVALAILSRVAPSVNVLAVAFPLQIGVGLMMIGAAIPLVGTFFLGWHGVYDGMLSRVMTALAGGAAGGR